MKYDTSGYYFDTFNESDGIIHDCGSFMAEYLYTGKPACYMMKTTTLSELNNFAHICLEHHYKAYNAREIYSFIKNVIDKGEDPKKEEREKFSKELQGKYYPHSGKAIVNYIKKELGIQ